MPIVEKFFHIDRRHQMSIAHLAQIKQMKNLRVLFEQLRREFGIETTEFHSSKNSLFIKPTPNDRFRFRGQTSNHRLGDYVVFRVATAVHTVWFRNLFNMGVTLIDAPEPKTVVSIEESGASIVHQYVFAYNGEVYCTVMCNGEFTVNDALFTPILGSHYHKLKEDKEEEDRRAHKQEEPIYVADIYTT